jgi:hypothetical protein
MKLAIIRDLFADGAARLSNVTVVLRVAAPIAP